MWVKIGSRAMVFTRTQLLNGASQKPGGRKTGGAPEDLLLERDRAGQQQRPPQPVLSVQAHRLTAVPVERTGRPVKGCCQRRRLVAKAALERPDCLLVEST